jgi:hypothetical protein
MGFPWLLCAVSSLCYSRGEKEKNLVTDIHYWHQERLFLVFNARMNKGFQTLILWRPKQIHIALLHKDSFRTSQKTRLQLYKAISEKNSKLKCTLEQTLRLCTGPTAHRGSRGIALLFHDHDTRRREGSASRPGRSLPPGKTRYPLYRRLGGLHGRSGQVRKISPPAGFDPRTVMPVASHYNV